MALIVAAVPGASPDLIYVAGRLRIHAARLLAVDEDGQPIDLVMAAFRTLLLLAVAYPAVTSRARIARVVQGRRRLLPRDNGVDQQIRALRRTLPPNEHGLPMIGNVRAEGWRLTTPVIAVRRETCSPTRP